MSKPKPITQTDRLWEIQRKRKNSIYRCFSFSVILHIFDTSQEVGNLFMWHVVRHHNPESVPLPSHSSPKTLGAG